MHSHTSLKNKILRSVFVLFLFSACSNSSQVADINDTVGDEVVIDLNDKRQTIRNFGASDAWTCQYVGLWPDEKKNQVADWLFSTEEDAQGKPKGIGLSMWRFNIGAGSAVQSNISDEWRRAEGFLNDDKTYDWSRQAGQRWFMHAAKTRGVKYFTGFTNSPPVQLTKNGKAFSSNGEEANIAPENYDEFSKFLVEVSKQFEKDGIPFTYLSPFNEPQWDWTGNNQEGSPYKNDEIYAITKVLDPMIQAENLQTKIQIGEAGKLNYLYEKADKPTRGEQIRSFFNSSSPLYVGDFKSVDRVISGHSYFTSAPAETLKSTREKVHAEIGTSSVPVEFWQSEYCILGDQEEIQAVGKDTGINPALYVARLIHHDLVLANASAWQWWLAVSAYDYKDGLVYVEKNKSDGTVEETKTMWALGNYSRFIRPGAQRVNVHSGAMDVNNVKGTMISSYHDINAQKLITVIVNSNSSEAEISLQVSGGDVKSWKPYLTGSGSDENLQPMQPIEAQKTIKVPKRSIMTLVGDLK